MTNTLQTVQSQLKSDPSRLRDFVQSTHAQAKKVGAALNCFISLNDDDTAQELQRLEKLLASGKGAQLPLFGVPVVIKDNISTRGVRTTCASKILENYVPAYDATVIERLKQAGAWMLGKANLDEFAMGSSTENSAFGPTRNPYDLKRVPGGSSGGSAAAVAAGLAPLSLGSDTGGSIRQPAALCGVVGFKPSYGRVSRYGLVAFASSLDQIGPFANRVADVAQVMDIISGHDAKDSTSRKEAPLSAVKHLQSAAKDLRGKKIGVISQFEKTSFSSDVATSFQQALQDLEKLGAKICKVDIPHIDLSIATYYIIATAEASSNLARFDGVRYGLRVEDATSTAVSLTSGTRSKGFGREVKQRIMLGTFALSSGYYDAYYGRATLVRQMLTEELSQAFKEVDYIVTPTSPTTAFPIGEKSSDPLAMYLSDVFTLAVNLAGLPAISLPCGIDAQGLPIGLQVIGRPAADLDVISGAAIYEHATKWYEKLKPSLH